MKKRIGLHLKPLKQIDQRFEIYEKILTANSLDTVRLCSSDNNFWDVVKSLDLFIYYWGQWDVERQIAKTIMPIIENELHIPCFPDLKTCWFFDDKIKEYLLMKSHNFPMIKSWVFWEKDEALAWAKQAPLPVVFKLKGGAGSRNVVLVKKRQQIVDLIKIMFKKGFLDNRIVFNDSLAPTRYFRLKHKVYTLKQQICGETIAVHNMFPNWNYHRNYIFFQEFLPANNFDVRVTTIGNRIFAFRRFNRDGDFRSSGSGKIDYDPDAIDMRCIMTASEVSSKLGFQTMAYDFLYDHINDEYRFCEISYGYVDTAIYNCPGYWDGNMNWYSGHYWPQYFHLVDALKMPDLKYTL